jgi:ankyrin repeat protein
MESLPTELLEIVALQLEIRDLARLMQCSRLLRERMKPWLYGTRDARNTAMIWACKHGELGVIRLATSYGASPSTVRLSQDLVNVWDAIYVLSKKTPFEAYTLYLAADAGQVDAFKLLIKLGAHVHDDKFTKRQHEGLMNKMCSSTDFVLLKLFLDAGLGKQVKESVLSHGIVAAMSYKAGTDVVQRLLDSGATPVSLQVLEPQVYITPFTSAILESSMPVVDLLLSQGAHISGTERSSPSRIPLHIPIFAAASAISKHGLAMMQLCLDRGIDINCRSRVVKTPGSSDMCYYNTTPLLVYLKSIHQWSFSDGDPGISPTAGLQFFVDNGALIDGPDELESNRYGQLCVARPLCINVLLDKWGVKELADANFLAFLKMLIRHSRSREPSSTILVKYDYQPLKKKKAQSQEHHEAILAGWRDLVAAMMRSPTCLESPSLLLHNYIVKKGMQPAIPGDLVWATIDHLLASGADINAPEGPKRRSALNELCVQFNRQDENYYLLHVRRKQSYRLQFVEFLLRRGADPKLKGSDRQNAIDILMGAKYYTTDTEDVVTAMKEVVNTPGNKHSGKVSKLWTRLLRSVGLK